MIRQKKISSLSTFCLSLFFFFFFSSPVFAAMYTYTGSSTLIDDGNGTFRIKFLTSGTFRSTSNFFSKLFLVGGGGGGDYCDSNASGAGGGGGFTTTNTSYSITANKDYYVIVGAGGATASRGETSYFNDPFGPSQSAEGGYPPTTTDNGEFGFSYEGGNGGSGGGSFIEGAGGNGGTNGSMGGWGDKGSPGNGQGSTTREFGEETGDLYAGGGGGGTQGLGGAGGGGNAGSAGQSNTGGGGGGPTSTNNGGAGGSGIVIIKFTDSTAPTCGSWSPSSSSWKKTATAQTFTLSSSTDAGGSGINVSGDSCTTDVTNNSTCTVTISDQAGNTTVCTSPVNKVDITAPTCGTWSPSSSPWKSSGTQTFTLSNSTDTGGSGISTAGGSCSASGTNNATCTVTISDQAGNTTVCTSPVNRIDSTFPVCGTWSPSSSWQKTNSTKTFTLSSSTDDGGSGISTAGGSCTASSTNNSTCTVQIRDNAYNYTTCTSPPNRIDTTAPTCGTWSPSSSPWKTSGTSTFTLSGSTDNTGGSGISIDGGSCTTGASNNYKCNVTITDIAGNTTSCQSPPNRIDTTTPTCGTWSPTSSPWKTSAATQTFDLSNSYDIASGINISGGSCTTANTNGATCTVNISDQAGNTSTCTSPINRIDTQPPYCGSWNPSWPTLKKSGTQTFTLSNSTDYDSSGISISGGSCTAASTNGATCTVNISDQAGNTVVCTSPGNRIDNINPIIESVKMTQASNSATVSWTTSNESAYSKIKYGLTESLESITNISNSLSSAASQTLSPLLSCTTYFYQPVAIDVVGNESLGEIKSFTTTGCASIQADSPVLSQSASSVNNDVGGSLALTTATEQITLNLPANFKNDIGITNPIVFQVKQLDEEQTINSTSIPDDDFLEDNNNHSNELISSVFDLKAYLNEDERLSEFDEPIMVSISYTDAQIEGIDLSTLSIYRYDGSIWQRLTTTIDRENKKLIAYTNHFSLFAAFGQTKQTSENNSSSSNNSNQTSVSSDPSVCTDSKPLFTSNLFQINTTKNTAKLFFSPQADTNKYYIGFSKNANAEEHGEEVTLLREGVQSHTIYHLDPNSTYYFKVRGQNGCTPGDWSNIFKIKTGKDAKTTVFYKSSSTKVVNIIQSVKNVVTKTKSKIVSQTVDSKITPEVTKTIETKIDNPVQNKESTSKQNTKKCFLWWCWN